MLTQRFYRWDAPIAIRRGNLARGAIGRNMARSVQRSPSEHLLARVRGQGQGGDVHPPVMQWGETSG